MNDHFQEGDGQYYQDGQQYQGEYQQEYQQ